MAHPDDGVPDGMLVSLPLGLVAWAVILLLIVPGLRL